MFEPPEEAGQEVVKSFTSHRKAEQLARIAHLAPEAQLHDCMTLVIPGDGVFQPVNLLDAPLIKRVQQKLVRLQGCRVEPLEPHVLCLHRWGRRRGAVLPDNHARLLQCQAKFTIAAHPQGKMDAPSKQVSAALATLRGRMCADVFLPIYNDNKRVGVTNVNRMALARGEGCL
jgi:hypothetical protein